MLYELRIYRFHPGKKKTFLEGFKKARRFMEKYGITFVAAWENLDREDEFLWIRSFANAQARDKATADQAADIAVQGAATLRHNAYKVPLMKALVKRAIRGDAEWTS